MYHPSQTQQVSSLRYLFVVFVIAILATIINSVVIITEYLISVAQQILINLALELQSHFRFKTMNYSLSICFTATSLSKVIIIHRAHQP